MEWPLMGSLWLGLMALTAKHTLLSESSLTGNLSKPA